MRHKTVVGIVCGGRSEVYDLSVKGGLDIAAQVDHDNYEVRLFVLDKDHAWFLRRREGEQQEILLGPRGAVLDRRTGALLDRIDVVFPTIYGPFGEDGRLQGFLEMLDVPYVGADVTGSAICMDKDVSQRLLRAVGIASPVSVTLRYGERLPFGEAVSRLGRPFFVKPCRLGSSIGISKVSEHGEYERAVAEAFRYGHKVLLEAAAIGRELRTAVIGNEVAVVAPTLGEVPLPPSLEFYDYHTKLNAPINRIPASLDEATAIRLRELTARAYVALEIEGLARIDWYLEPNGELLFGEANTLPCFSLGSTFRELWAHSGLETSKLVDALIQHAVARGARNGKLAFSAVHPKNDPPDASID